MQFGLMIWSDHLIPNDELERLAAERSPDGAGAGPTAKEELVLTANEATKLMKPT